MKSRDGTLAPAAPANRQFDSPLFLPKLASRSCGTNITSSPPPVAPPLPLVNRAYRAVTSSTSTSAAQNKLSGPEAGSQRQTHLTLPPPTPPLLPLPLRNPGPLPHRAPLSLSRLSNRITEGTIQHYRTTTTHHYFNHGTSKIQEATSGAPLVYSYA